MAHHKSALKRIRQSKKKRLYNRLNKKRVKEAIKAVKTAENFQDAFEKLKLASKVLDKVAAMGVLHKNNVANKKSKLALFVNSLKDQKN